METEAKVIVKAVQGDIEGSIEGGLAVFRGIPYATPPTGEKRWSATERIRTNQSIIRASRYGAVAPQPPSRAAVIKEFRVDETQSEDCLFINVITPRPDQAHRPVMVWIHGGNFTMGSGSQSAFQGSTLVKSGNVVLVTFNYRLGPLGFLRLEEATRGRITSTGNEGLLDQIAALEWVRDNIEAFGGDPENITVFGESAGALSIECLMIMPQARGLFHKAILQSSISHAVRPINEAVRYTRQWLSRLGSGEDEERLRWLPVEKLITAQNEIAEHNETGVMPPAPVIDGEVLPLRPAEAFSKGITPEIPLMAGTNLEETRLFSVLNGNPKVTEEALVRRCQKLFPDTDVMKIVLTYREARRKRGESTAARDIYIAMQTDIRFRLPTLRLLEAHYRAGRAAFNYLFDWRSPAKNGIYGACHGLEIGFVFGTYSEDFGGVGQQAERLSNQLQDAWVAFARTGNPSCDSLGEWPEYGDRRTTMRLGANSHVEDDAYGEERRILDSAGTETTMKA